MRGQAKLAAEVGFDGVMTSEHHGGFGGYLPNPVQMTGWLLEAMPQGWASPCPLLLPLRPWALVAEELAWLAARFPGRVGLGVAAGSLEDDFTIMGTNKDNLVARFAEGLNAVTAALAGRDAGLLAGDIAIKRCAEHPVPVISAGDEPDRRPPCRRRWSGAAVRRGQLSRALPRNVGHLSRGRRKRADRAGPPGIGGRCGHRGRAGTPRQADRSLSQLYVRGFPVEMGSQPADRRHAPTISPKV